jgi:hypothetical protein
MATAYRLNAYRFRISTFGREGAYCYVSAITPAEAAKRVASQLSPWESAALLHGPSLPFNAFY